MSTRALITPLTSWSTCPATYRPHRARRGRTDHHAACGRGTRGPRRAHLARYCTISLRQNRWDGYMAPRRASVSAHDTCSCPHCAARSSYRRGFNQGAPDLAVEVFSPSDSVRQLMRKVKQYFAAGCHTVWIVYPEQQEVKNVPESSSLYHRRPGDLIEAPELLPGLGRTSRNFSRAADSGHPVRPCNGCASAESAITRLPGASTAEMADKRRRFHGDCCYREPPTFTLRYEMCRVAGRRSAPTPKRSLGVRHLD